MVMAEADYLDRETILRKLPNVSADEVLGILDRLDAQEQDMTEITPRAIVTDDETDNGEDIENE